MLFKPSDVSVKFKALPYSIAEEDYPTLSLGDIDHGLSAVDEVVGEVVHQSPIEVLVHIAKAVALGGQVEHIEAFIGPNQSLHHTRTIAGNELTRNSH